MIFQTSRLTLRPVSGSDLSDLWRMWTDPEVRRFLWDDRVISREEAATTIADCEALSAGGLGLWVLHTRDAIDSTPAIGCAGLFPVTTAATYEPRVAGLVEPLVALRPEHWGRGYAAEALQALIEHARSTLGLTQLAAVSDVPNVRSDRMLRRAGFNELSETDGPRYRLRTYLLNMPAHLAPSTCT
jgi:RimJ/RimL family protein N-acetyltransferase